MVIGNSNRWGHREVGQGKEGSQYIESINEQVLWVTERQYPKWNSAQGLGILAGWSWHSCSFYL